MMEDDPSDKTDENLTTDDELLAEAKERMKMCEEYMINIHGESKKDLQYLDSNQWDTEVKTQREQDSRPCLTINRLNAFVNQVKNDYIQNSPSIKISPVSNTDKATANVLNGMVRHIVNNIDGKSALDWALTCAIRCGIGFVRVKADYLWDDSFAQELLIERIEDPLLVYFPLPLCKLQDWSDAPYTLIRTLLSKRDYKEIYGEDEFKNLQEWEEKNAQSGGEYWVTKESVWLCEYFKIEKKTETIYLLSDGSVTADSENLPEGITVIKERETEHKKVMRYLLSGGSVLDKTEILSQYIPIIPVLGDELSVEGKKNFKSLIRDIRDVQMMYNMLKSKETEQICLTAKPQWMAPEGQIPPNLMVDWKAANTKNIAVLTYKSEGPSGNPFPPPQQIQYRELDVATVNAAKECVDDMKAITGIHDASLGAQGNEVSGKAIMARVRQGDTANSHFYESFIRALRHIGRIFIDMCPSYYTLEQEVRIVGEDEVDDIVKINTTYPDPKTGQIYDIKKVGRYAVTVSTGPTYESRRLETASGIISLVQANPNLFPLLGDILLQNLDWVGSERAVRRLQATMDPKVLAADADTGSGIDQMQSLKAQLQMLQQKSQQDDAAKAQMTQLIGTLNDQIKMKVTEHQAQLQATQIKASAEIQKAGIGLEQEKIRQHSQYVQHAVDAAIDLHKTGAILPPSNPMQSPGPGQFPGNPGMPSQPSNSMGQE